MQKISMVPGSCQFADFVVVPMEVPVEAVTMTPAALPVVLPVASSAMASPSIVLPSSCLPVMSPAASAQLTIGLSVPSEFVSAKQIGQQNEKGERGERSEQGAQPTTLSSTSIAAILRPHVVCMEVPHKLSVHNWLDRKEATETNPVGLNAVNRTGGTSEQPTETIPVANVFVTHSITRPCLPPCHGACPTCGGSLFWVPRHVVNRIVGTGKTNSFTQPTAYCGECVSPPGRKLIGNPLIDRWVVPVLVKVMADQDTRPHTPWCVATWAEVTIGEDRNEVEVVNEKTLVDEWEKVQNEKEKEQKERPLASSARSIDCPPLPSCSHAVVEETLTFDGFVNRRCKECGTWLDCKKKEQAKKQVAEPAKEPAIESARPESADAVITAPSASPVVKKESTNCAPSVVSSPLPSTSPLPPSSSFPLPSPMSGPTCWELVGQSVRVRIILDTRGNVAWVSSVMFDGFKGKHVDELYRWMHATSGGKNGSGGNGGDQLTPSVSVVQLQNGQIGRDMLRGIKQVGKGKK